MRNVLETEDPIYSDQEEGDEIYMEKLKNTDHEQLMTHKGRIPIKKDRDTDEGTKSGNHTTQKNATFMKVSPNTKLLEKGANRCELYELDIKAFEEEISKLSYTKPKQ